MKLRSVQVLTLALGITALAATDVAAQRRRGLVDVSPTHERRGFWLEGGIGAGRERFKFEGESYSSSINKPTVSFGLGGTVNPALRLGFEATLWLNSYFDDVAEVDVTETLTALMAVARFYPARSAGFFLKGGGGFGVSAVDLDFGDGTSEGGFAWVLGAGYEIRLSRALFLTPSVELFQHAFEKRDEPTLYEQLVNLGLRLTWQPGR